MSGFSPEQEADNAAYANLEHEMAQLDAQEGREPDPHGNLGGEGRAYDPQQDGVPAAPQQYQPQPQYQPEPIPDKLDDPIGHFTGRIDQLANLTNYSAGMAQQRDFYDQIVHSERKIREEVPDYDAACEHLEQGRIDELNRTFPDGNRQAEVLAHQQGFESAAHMKAALLNRDRVSISHWAVRNGVSPAETYYRLAAERGYRPQVAITNTQRKQLSNALERAADTGNYADFDRLWDGYAKVAKEEERRARR